MKEHPLPSNYHCMNFHFYFIFISFSFHFHFHSPKLFNSTIIRIQVAFSTDVFDVVIFIAMTVTTAKTSFENKHSNKRNYFAINPSSSHSTLMVKYATNGLRVMPMN